MKPFILIHISDYIISFNQVSLVNDILAGEWLYLCAAHHEPKQCSAIDYISHTLEGAQALLGSEVFYSQTHSPETTGKLIQNVARR